MKKLYILTLVLFISVACNNSDKKETYVGIGQVVETLNCQEVKSVFNTKNNYKACSSKISYKNTIYVSRLSSFVSRGQQKDIGLNAPVDMCSLESGIIIVCSNYRAN